MSNYNAYLTYSPSGKPVQVYRMWVMEYAQTHQVGGSSAQSKMYKHFYPRNYTPGPISVKGRVRTQEDYNNLASYIRKHQLELVNSTGASNVSNSTQLPLLGMGITGEGIFVQGFISSFQAGAKRWNPAPEFNFDFFVIKDAHSKNSEIHPAYSVRSMWTGDFIDEGVVENKALESINSVIDQINTVRDIINQIQTP